MYEIWEERDRKKMEGGKKERNGKKNKIWNNERNTSKIYLNKQVIICTPLCREIQTVVLSNIATMSAKRRGMFEPFLKSFFVRSNDATHIRILKLEILTNIASETSISTILRELQVGKDKAVNW